MVANYAQEQEDAEYYEETQGTGDSSSTANTTTMGAQQEKNQFDKMFEQVSEKYVPPLSSHQRQQQSPN